MDNNKFNNITDNDEIEVNEFTEKINKVLNKDNENNVDTSTDDVKIKTTPKEWWESRYCALANSTCRGPKCMQWDFYAPNFVLDTVGDCSLVNINLNLRGIVNMMSDNLDTTKMINHIDV